MVVVSSGQITITDVEDGKPGRDGQVGENLLLDTNAMSVSKNYANQDRYYSHSENHALFDFGYVQIQDPPVASISTGVRFKNKEGSSGKNIGICWYGGDYKGVPLKAGTKYTISCYARKISGASTAKMYIYPMLKDWSIYGNFLTDYITTNEWVQLSKTFEFDPTKMGDNDPKAARIYFTVLATNTELFEVQVCGFKLEEGEVATPYKPSPVETTIELGRKADSESVLEQQRLLKEAQDQALKSLNDDIMRRVSTDWADLIKRIRDTDEAGRKAAEESLRVMSARLRSEVSKQFGEYAYIREFITTQVVESEEGLSIGKQDNSERLVFTPNRISFMSAGKEIASIAQGRLNIDSGAFTLSLQIGHFITFQDPSDPTRNITKYIEG
jgi:hypothetical protein